MPAARRPGSPPRPTAPGCSSRRWVATSAAPTCCSAPTARSCRTTSGTSASSPRCAAPSSTRRWSPWPRVSSGCPTPPFVALATVDPDAFVLVYELIDGSSLDGVDPGRLDDQVIGQIWSQVARLRSRRIAHRDLRLANIFLGARRPGLDHRLRLLGAGRLGPAARHRPGRAAGVAHRRVGVDRSVDAAVAAVGAEAVAGAAVRLRPYALSGATRTAFKARPGLLDELRSTVAASRRSDAWTGRCSATLWSLKSASGDPISVISVPGCSTRGDMEGYDARQSRVWALREAVG